MSNGKGIMRCLPSGWQGEGGSSLLELALLSPLLLLLFAGSVDLGEGCYAAIKISAAASAGAEYGVLNPTDTNGMKLAASANASGLNGFIASASWGCECSDGSSASAQCTASPSCSVTRVKYVTVATSMSYVPVFAFPGLPGTMLLKGSARLRAAY